MDAFKAELMRRSPLAGCVLELSDYLFDDALLDSIWQEHRGRCYQDVLRFEDFVRLMRDALAEHGGSAHALFLDLEARQAEPVDESNFYRKLSRTPVELSRALLSGCTARLGELLPCDALPLPGCFDAFAVIVGDGKKIKNATKRLKPTRGYSGKLIGATALVALDVRSGMAIAMSDSLDGLANDVPLVPALMEQLRAAIARPLLSIWDRQFDDPRTLGVLSARAGDAYVVRMKQNYTFGVESCEKTKDAQGRQVIDEIGSLGKGKSTLRVRRITLRRGKGEDDVVLLSNLFDRAAFAAGVLLELYRKRWGIEAAGLRPPQQVFQQVTETFALQHLIGSSPRAVLLQLAYCLLLYNLVQLIKLYVAQDGKVLAGVVSTFYLFKDVRRELVGWRTTPMEAGRVNAAISSRCVRVCTNCCVEAGRRSPTPRRATPSRAKSVHRPSACTAGTAPFNACWKAGPGW